MRRRPVLLTTAALAALAAVLGLRVGQGELTETDVIGAAAARYVAETGGAAADCAAVPGEGAIWLVVTCAGTDRRHVYRFDHAGRPLSPPAEA